MAALSRIRKAQEQLHSGTAQNALLVSSVTTAPNAYGRSAVGAADSGSAMSVGRSALWYMPQCVPQLCTLRMRQRTRTNATVNHSAISLSPLSAQRCYWGHSGDAMAMSMGSVGAAHMKGDVIHHDQRESALHSLFRKCDAAGTLTLRNSNPHGCRRTQARQATGLHRRERRTVSAAHPVTHPLPKEAHGSLGRVAHAPVPRCDNMTL